jgi:branched-chain amino acid transport system substrate-binding protein
LFRRFIGLYPTNSRRIGVATGRTGEQAVTSEEDGRRARPPGLPHAGLTRRTTLATGVAAVASPLLGSRVRAAGEPIVIGWVGPLSPPGGYAEGALMKDAATMAAAEVNARGGLLGRPVQIVYADTRGMPAEGRAAAERLVQENKIAAAFGEFHSPVALAEMEVFHRYGVPFMACDVWSDEITAKGYPEVFRNAPTVSLIDTTIGKWIAAAGFKRVALLAEKNDVGLAARTAIGKQLEEHGIAFDAVDADPSLTDFTAQILRYKSVTPHYDLFCTEFSEAGAYDLIRQAHDLGFAPTAGVAMYNSGGSAVDPTFWQNVGGAGVGLVTENVGLPKAAWNDKTRDFASAFKAKYKAQPTGAVMESYDGGWLLFDAIRTAGSTDPKAIIGALEKTEYVGTRGKYSFSTNKYPAWNYHQFMQAPLTIIQYSAEKQSVDEAPILWPRDLATVAYTYKPPPV